MPKLGSAIGRVEPVKHVAHLDSSGWSGDFNQFYMCVLVVKIVQP